MNSPDPAHGLTAENILASFPIALQGDPSAAALADVAARLLARRPEEIDRLQIYPNILRLDENLLDILGIEILYWHQPEQTALAGPNTSPQGTGRHAMLPPLDIHY